MTLGGVSTNLRVCTGDILLGNALSYRSLSVTLPSGLLLRHNPVLLVILCYCQFLCTVLSLSVEIEVAMSCASESTKLTLERLKLFMNRSTVMFQLGGNEEHFSTDIARQGLVLDMNHFYVNFQIVFVVESFTTVWAYKNDSTVIFLIMEIEFASELENFVALVAEEGSFTFIVNFILMTF